MTTILWFRRDLRLHDHPPLLTAAEEGEVLPLVVIDPGLISSSSVRVAGYLRCVAALADSIESHGGRLVVRLGDPAQIVPALASEVGAERVHVTLESEPYGRRRDAEVRAALASRGIDLVATGTPYAIGPGVITKRDGSPYTVFTPFSRAWRDYGAPGPAPLPPVAWEAADSEMLPEAPATSFELPPLGEEAARAQWSEFLETGLVGYANNRDRPDLDATSRMSRHLKYGAIHPRTMLADIAASDAAPGSGADVFVNELIWREFYADVLFHRPDSEWADLRTSVRAMEYDDPATDPRAAARLAAWKEGRTGYPIVDAGMRQLLAEGWMHNRLRMIVASFLVKDLHLWWPHGAEHFLDHLIDGDQASNQHGWQWVAGTGTDAAPYFRVFNPLTQGEKFDKSGDYVRRYVPELLTVEGKRVHDLRAVAGVDGYPQPIVDHAAERKEALRRYQSAR